MKLPEATKEKIMDCFGDRESLHLLIDNTVEGRLRKLYPEFMQGIDEIKNHPDFVIWYA